MTNRDLSSVFEDVVHLPKKPRLLIVVVRVQIGAISFTPLPLTTSDITTPHIIRTPKAEYRYKTAC